MQSVLEGVADRSLQVYVIWEPILWTDWAKPGAGVLARVSDSRAGQFWDPQHLFAYKLRRDMETDPDHPRPTCCGADAVLWDLVAVYPRGARWDSALPRAVLIDGPVAEVSKLQTVIAELTAKPRK